MELEKALIEELDNVAQKLGLRSGHYKIVVDAGHEYLYRGVETQVTIKGENGECKHLKIRRPPTAPVIEIKIPWDNCFFNNVHYYKTVLPILKTYGNVPMAPAYYGSSLRKGEEYLILEDLVKSRGYQKLGPFPGLSRMQVKEAIKMLAFFHCTVQLWRAKNPEQFKSICGQFRPFVGPKYPHRDELHRYEKIIKEMFAGIWELMRKQGEYHGTFAKLFKNVRKMASYALKEGSEVEDQPWTTLANCFTYTTNIFFKFHTHTGAVIDVGLEDWSAARLGSPALDLSLLLFSTPSTDVYPETTALANEYITDHLSLSDLKEKHLPRYGVFGVFAGVFINVAKSIEDKLDIRLDQITARTMNEDSFTSNIIPDVKDRLVAIVKAAIENNIL